MKNLARLLGQATPRRLDGPYYGSAMDMDASAALIAAAPQMADLLIACEEALTILAECAESCVGVEDTSLREEWVAEIARAALARLADFDKELM